MKKVNNILRKFVIHLLILLVVCPLIISQGNATTDPITITDEIKMESIYQFSSPFFGNFIVENLLIGFAEKSILIYDISDIYSIKLLQNFNTNCSINCMTKKDSYIYVGGETLLIFKLENNSLELLHENVLINVTSMFDRNIRYLDIKDNLLLIAGFREITICDLSTGYYPTMILFLDHYSLGGTFNAHFFQEYLIYVHIDPAGFQGTIVNRFNNTSNKLEIIKRISENYHFKYYKDYMYVICHGHDPYLFQYNFSNFELQYVENFVKLDYYPGLRAQLDFYSNYAFIYKSGSMQVYDIDNYLIKKIYNHEFDFQYTGGFEHSFTCFKIINNLCFISSPYRSEIFELRFVNTMRFGIYFNSILFLAPLLLLGYSCLKKRKSYKIKLNNPRDS